MDMRVIDMVSDIGRKARRLETVGNVIACSGDQLLEWQGECLGEIVRDISESVVEHLKELEELLLAELNANRK